MVFQCRGLSRICAVKICGITSTEDARKAAEYGADMLGFVLAESPRKITVDRLKQIGRAIPEDIKKIGVFVNSEIFFVKQLLDDKLIDYAQLHGDEDIEYCRKLPVKNIIKAIKPQSSEDIKIAGVFKDLAAILVDTFSPYKRGGTGKTADWGSAVSAKDIGPPVILSGGLNVNNVRDAIETVRPYAVDVSSGVEKSPGKKDHELMKEFISTVKAVNA